MSDLEFFPHVMSRAEAVDRFGTHWSMTQRVLVNSQTRWAIRQELGLGHHARMQAETIQDALVHARGLDASDSSEPEVTYLPETLRFPHLLEVGTPLWLVEESEIQVLSVTGIHEWSYRQEDKNVLMCSPRYSTSSESDGAVFTHDRAALTENALDYRTTQGRKWLFTDADSAARKALELADRLRAIAERLTNQVAELTRGVGRVMG